MTTTPGFYGKLAARGDFVGRHLPREFTAHWDSWLQQAMESSRTLLGERWLQHYLHGPIWRFAISPGCCGENAYCGVMMASIDRVGRYFPLTLAAPLAADSDLLSLLDGPQQWFEQLEQHAL